MSVNDLIALCALLLSIGGAAIAIVFWYVIALPNLLKYKRAGKDAPQSLQRGEPPQRAALYPTIILVISSVLHQTEKSYNSEKRKYGLERDFAHLKRNYEHISNNLLTILSELDNRFDRVERDILEVKSNLNLSTKRKNEEY